MKTLIVMMAGLMAVPALADGWQCQTVQGDLNIKIFNHTDPSQGTRNGAVMVLSDPYVSGGRKTIASFTDVKSTLSSSGAFYMADVDLRVVESRRKGELILGTKLGYVDSIQLDIDFSYANPIEHGEAVDGKLVVVKRDGDRIHRDVECTRYLKN